jgi:hypothetical protein
MSALFESAFPVIPPMDGNIPCPIYPPPDGGMSIRDYFAAAAVQGWLSNAECPPPRTAKLANRERALSIAEDAYLIADAMLHVRAKV